MIITEKSHTAIDAFENRETVSSDSGAGRWTVSEPPLFGQSPTVRTKVGEGEGGYESKPRGEGCVDVLIRGRSLAFWRRERIEAARSLLDNWNSIAAAAGSPGFAVAVDGFFEKLNAEMQRFRGVPQEDIASGMFQLVVESLSGEHFARLEKMHLTKPVAAALGIASKEGPLSVESYNEALRFFVDAQLRG